MGLLENFFGKKAQGTEVQGTKQEGPNATETNTAEEPQELGPVQRVEMDLQSGKVNMQDLEMPHDIAGDRLYGPDEMRLALLHSELIERLFDLGFGEDRDRVMQLPPEDLVRTVEDHATRWKELPPDERKLKTDGEVDQRVDETKEIVKAMTDVRQTIKDRQKKLEADLQGVEVAKANAEAAADKVDKSAA
tara:strand:+ start:667 stop:1239 length:573 start_codon:yes stop_codon:yes gene_type:complete